MKNYLLWILLSITYPFSSYAQVSYTISTHDPTSPIFRYLLLTNAQIEVNDTINEEILDLSHPMVIDSILDRRKEHHQVFLVGWWIHAFGNYNWRAINMTKEKIVGTVRHNSRSGEEEYTEYDINYDLNFHLPRYLNRAFRAYDAQAKTKRQDFRSGFHYKKHHTDYTKPPFVRDTNHVDITQYRIHCELTPQREFRPQLHHLFYPTLPNMSLAEHPNFSNEHPSMGMYGAACLDCNHSCHPELHPYEWIWWLNLRDSSSTNKTWIVGLLKDGSNRFHHWSHNPKTGTISIPFAFTILDKNTHPTITIDPLVFNRFLDAELKKLTLPTTLIDAKQENVTATLVDDKGNSFSIPIHFQHVLKSDGVKYWFSDVNWDEQQHILSGYFNIAASVTDLYTVRIIMANGEK